MYKANMKSKMLGGELPEAKKASKAGLKGIDTLKEKKKTIVGHKPKGGKRSLVTKDEARSKAVEEQMKKNVEGLPKSGNRLPFSY